MSNVTNLVDKALGILDPVEAAFKESEKTPPKVPTVITPASSEDDIDNDYKYQRENLYSLIERGQDAIDGILELAKEGEHPRAYEVALNGIKQVADVTEKLADLQDKMKKLKEVPGSNAPKSVTNALFVGSTAELQKMLKGKDDG
jgi:hypothetical protein|tara:strand:+ start:434 stop:868 length:435 start_codon:yes stop_codon:yes gene_type:complete